MKQSYYNAESKKKEEEETLNLIAQWHYGISSRLRKKQKEQLYVAWMMMLCGRTVR
jgi:hypothetical protein